MHAIEAALRKSDMSATDVRQTRATDAAHSSPAHETGCTRTTRSCTLRCWADFYANSCKVCTVKLALWMRQRLPTEQSNRGFFLK